MKIDQVVFVRYPWRLGCLVYFLLVMLVYSSVDTPEKEDTSFVHNYVSPQEHTIFEGNHPRVSFSHNSLSKMKGTDNDLVIQYRRRSRSSDVETMHQIEEVPQYFTDIDDRFVEREVEYRVEHGRWSDQVLLEKLYFGLLFGRSGYPNHYYVGDEDHGMEPAYKRKLERAYGWSYNVFRRVLDVCVLEGIFCIDEKIRKIILPSFELTGTLTDAIQYLTDLEVLNLRGNSIKGTIPSAFGKLTNLKVLILSANSFSGHLPTFSTFTRLEKLWLAGNQFVGRLAESLPSISPSISFMDISNNRLSGSIPESFFTDCRSLVDLYLETNLISGHLPENTERLTILESFKANSNRFTGTLPVSWMKLDRLRRFVAANNSLTGTIPSEILELSALQSLDLSGNRFAGQLPIESPDITREEGWSHLTKLSILKVGGNKLSGTIPSTLFMENSTLVEIDISDNSFSGSLPDNIGRLSHLRRLCAQRNLLQGTLPTSMARLNPNLDLNLTDNRFSGTVPKTFCGSGGRSNSLLFRQFGCDAVLCPPGTFSPSGAATMEYGCRPCVTSDRDDDYKGLLPNSFLGRRSCPSTTFVHGDLDGDGHLSDREVLRLLWVYTVGSNWGANFAKWGDVGTGECLLNGVSCSDSGKIIKIDLSGAVLCSDGGRVSRVSDFCHGLPGEIGRLSQLTVLQINSQKHLRTTIPSEIGLLTKLQFLDLGSSPFMGSIPESIGNLSSLKILNLAGCHLTGALPEGLYRLTNLEKLYLSLNLLSGSIATSVGKLTNLKELMVSRATLSGPIPTEIGALVNLENMELYGNKLTGTIPSSIGSCSSLKRIDIYHNKLTGRLPNSLTQLSSLQILHVKSNHLTGTIHSDFGTLPFLIWFDVSMNQLHGTIADSFGLSRSLKDFRVGGNMIHEPIPVSLCSNTHINGGLTRTYGCDGVICRLGTYSDRGHATHSEGCKPCPDGESTLYLGASECEVVGDHDILAMFYNVMYVGSSNAMQLHQWKDPEGDDWCTWKGITCDSDGEIQTLQFPLLGLDDSDQN